MGKSLGINVKVDFKEANKQLDDFEKKWNDFGKEPLNLKVNTKEATSSIETFRQKFQSIKKEIESGLNLKVSDMNFDSKGMSSIAKSSEQLAGGLKAASKVTTEIESNYQNLDGVVQKFNKTNIDSILKATDSHRILNDIKAKGSNESIQDIMDEQAALKEIARLTKEISSLEQKSIGKSVGEVEVLNKRIQSSSTQLNTLRESFSKAFGYNSDIDWSVKQSQDMGQHNLGIRLAANEVTNRKQATAYTKELIGLENQRFSLLQKAEGAGELEAAALKEQADAILLKVMRTREYNNEGNLSTADKNRINDLMLENELIAQVADAKRKDANASKEIAAQQKRAFDEAKASQKELFAIQKEIVKLEAQEDNDTLDTKGRQKLDQLKQQLEVVQSISDARKKSAIEDGQAVLDQLQKEQQITQETYELKSKQNKENSGLSNEDAERLSLMQRMNSEQMKMVESAAKAQAQTKLQNQEYDKLKESISRVDKLNDQLAKAGTRETEQIMKSIAAEEDYQETIRETIRVKGLSNAETEKELQQIKQNQNRVQEQNLNAGLGKDQDERRYSGIFATVFDPMRVYQEGKQAALKMYESVKTLDTAFVNIEKVASVPSEVLEEFSANISEQASAVGKAAEDYAVSVERWLTTGRSFQESQDLAQVSSMGGFVGNIGEEEMVKYMSVPLQSYKKDMLEAADVVNAMNEVSNNNAVEMEDLGKAYERAGHTAATSGTSFAELTGLITGANAATLAGGEKVGTALKAIDLNFNKISTGITTADEDRLNFFKGIGVELKDTKGQLRSTYEIVGDIEKVWDTLNSDEKGQATLYAAGKNHASIFQGMISGWGNVKKATKEAEIQLGLTNKESGSAYQEFEKQQESVEFKATALSNSWQELLRTLAGGREGVNGFLDILQQLVDTGNNLVSNDRFMDIAKTVGKLVLVMAGVQGAKKGFSVLSSGIGDVGLALKAIKGLGSATKTIEGGTKALGFFGKAGAGLGAMIPIVGGVIGALTLLDAATGGAVWDTFGKAIEWTAEQFESAETKAKKANEEFVKTQELLKKDLSDNKLLNGTIEKADAIIQTWEELDAKKKKRQKETGDDNELFLTNEEFQNLSTSVNQYAEEMGIDIRLTMNDYDTIKKQMEELMSYKEQLSSTELSKAFDTQKELVKPKDLEKDKAAWKEEVERAKEHLTMRQGQYNYSGGKSEKEIAKRKKNLEEAEARLRELENFYTTEAAKNSSKADQERINALIQLKNDLGKQAEAGTLNEAWGTTGTVEQRQDALVPIVAYGRELNAEAQKYQKYKEELERAKKIFEGTSGEKAEVKIPELHEWIKKVTGNENITTNLNQWTNEEDGSGELQAIFKAIDDQIAQTNKRTEKFAENLHVLSKGAELSQKEFELMYSTMEKGGAEYIEMLTKMNPLEASSMLGINSLFMDKFADTEGGWEGQVLAVQTQLDKLSKEDYELALKLNLVGEDGLFDGDTLNALIGIPDEINTKFNIIDDEGNIKIENTLEMLKKISETEFDFKGEILDVNGEVSLDKLLEKLKTLNETELKDFLVKIGVEGEEKAEKAGKTVDELDGKEGTAKVNVVEGDTSGADKANEKVEGVDGKEGTAKVNVKEGDTSGVDTAQEKLNGIEGQTATAEINADDTPLNQKVVTTGIAMSNIDLMEGSAIIKGDDALFQQTMDGVKNTPPPSIGVTVVGYLDRVLQRIFGGGSVSISANVTGKNEKSVGIIDRNMGRSFSSSISEAAGVPQSKTGKSSSTSTYSSDKSDAKVNSDVWRYWSQELFKGLPLERSMEDLENSITKASDNYAKLIPLYKQQISLVSKQIAHEQAMQKATQAEMNDTLNKLRAQGFTTKGNQVTNLGKAKSFTGDKATEVDTLLSTWRTLYESLDSIKGKINSLNLQKWEIDNDIKDAQIAQEAETIEKSLKKTEALLTTIENHLSLLSKKESLVSDSDVELKLTVQEESANDAKRNIGQLVNEFNRLSKTTIKYEENAEDVKSQMESLKKEILSNADAIIQYRESMNQLRIDRLLTDYAKFNEVIERNNTLLNSNIESLKEGLISGTSMKDLQSAQLENVSFDRKNQLDKQYQDRLQLEAKIDSALDAFSKKNVDRAKNVANAQLQIEKSKYSQLLQMEKTYSNGKTPTFKEVSGNLVDIGAIQTAVTNENKVYQQWTDKMKSVSNQYTKEFSAMRDAYDKAISGAKTQQQKDNLTNKFIVDQLKLQEKIQKQIISLNNEMVAQAQKELKNTTLTTEQREELEQAIIDYKDSSIDAQESIKDIIRSRFELEFELLDEAVAKAEKYSEKLEHLMSIAELVGTNSSNKQGIVDSIYQAKMNEYNNAKKSLEKLRAEQSKYLVDSFEWNILQEKIEEVDDSMRDLTISLLEANKNVLGNKLDSFSDSIAKGALDGKTLDEWNDFQDRWAVGVEKEIELDKIRQRLLEIESDVNKERLEILDRQDKVSQRELEYLDKQTKVLELQYKLNNLDKERTVQTLVKKDDGTWDWEYVADQTEIDKTKEELKEAEKDLEAYRQEQRGKYVSDIQDALDRAKSGEFESVDSLKKELEDIRNVYGAILTDIPNLNMGSMEEILKSYQDYLNENKAIVNDSIIGGDKDFENKLNKVGTMFETSFKTIAQDLGKVISDSLVNALSSVSGMKRSVATESYVIQSQELVFPNVTDTTGFEDVLINLPQLAKQNNYSK